MKKYLIVFFVLTYITTWSQISSGFKVGLNFSTIRGPLETDDNGKEVESNSFGTGFHVGAAINYKVTDLFGARLEILFSQKGTSYSYDGQSYFVLNTEAGRKIVTTGNRKMDLSLTNAYIDLPLIAYFKLGSKIEVSGGIGLGFLVASSATGEMTYSGQASNGAPVEKFIIGLDNNYFKDEIGEIDLTDATIRTLNGETSKIPRNAGAYFEYTDAMKGSAFNVIDLSLNAGLSYFINRGLYFGLRLNYGLSDVSNKDFDVSKVKLNGDQLIKQDDKDTNLAIQASIGFSF